jgi:hypothetical protein
MTWVSTSISTLPDGFSIEGCPKTCGGEFFRIVRGDEGNSYIMRIDHKRHYTRKLIYADRFILVYWAILTLLHILSG